MVATRPGIHGRRAARVTGIVLVLAFALLYGATVAPGMLPADGGEFQLRAVQLGVNHPPGFPLYTLLSHLATRLPLPLAPALKVNLLSVLTGSAALWFVYDAARRLSGRLTGGLLAAGALGLSTTYWSQATTANIRSLTALFSALAFWSLVAWLRSPPGERRLRRRWLLLLSASLGLGLTHHPSLIFIGLVMVLVVIREEPGLLRPRRWAPLALAALTGLIPLLYFPWRAQAPGAPADLPTWSGLANHVLALGFRGDLFVFLELPAFYDRLGVMVDVMRFQFTGPLLLAMVAGLVVVARVERRLAWLLGGTFLVHLLVTATYRAPQTVEYMIPAYIPATLCLAPLASSSWRRLWRSRTGPAAWGPGDARALWLTLLILLTVDHGWQRWPSFWQLHMRQDTRDTVSQILSEAPEGATVLANWHWVTPLWYAQQIEGRRSDLSLVYVFPGAAPYAQTWVDRITELTAIGKTVVVTYYDEQAFASVGPGLPRAQTRQYGGPPLEALPRTLRPLDWSLGQAIDLGGYALDRSALAAGETARLSVAWRPRVPLDPGTMLFAHLVTPAGRLVAQSDQALQPQSEGWTLTQFHLTPRLEAAPGRAILLLGAYRQTARGIEPLLDPTGQGRTPLSDLQIVAGSTPPITRNPTYRPLRQGDRVLIGYDWDTTVPGPPRLYLHWRTPAGFVTEVTDRPEGEYRLAPWRGPWGLTRRGKLVVTASHYVPLGEGIVWHGPLTDPARPWARGQGVPLYQTFASQGPIWRDYGVSIRLVGYEPDDFHWEWWDLDDAFGVPAMGAIPTLKWIGQTRIGDPHRLAVPADATVGQRAGVLVGLYDLFSGRPLPVLDERLEAATPWLTTTIAP